VNAIVAHGDRLDRAEVPAPESAPGHVRVRVRATAVNRADLHQRAGHYPPPPGKSAILGLEAAGEVVEAEADSPWQPGDRVCALLAGGGYADEVVVPVGHLLPIPEGMDFTHAAALPEALATAWLNLWGEAALAPGERVLVHAGGSGVGTAAIQLCRAFGNPCWVTAGNTDKVARCVALGAAGGADRFAEDFAARVPGWTHGHGMDVILDPVGGAYLERNLRSLAIEGRLVVIGLLGGRSAELDLGRLLVKRLRVVGSTLRSRSDADKTALISDLRARVWPLVESGEVVPVIDRVMPIGEADAAHRAIASDATFGKVVLVFP